MYTPTPVPPQAEQLVGYLRRETLNIANAIQSQVSSISLQTLNVAPTKPRAGLVVVADGTNWNPGSGAGVYCYYGSAWHFLG